ncbi:uncharacterized protein LOC133926177 [Phragmites australis]|uniref:uncharacterized protein LOC133926177 n=1 Tax=Phragmites australis TaxID=29695 RepID=UPI002D76BFDA|nr:uncharacterized protein LOC133926177 [Phragmites australis]
MDKILAFSIMSSSPADIAAGGYSTRLFWRTSAGKQQVEKAPKQEKAEQQGSPPVTERKQETRARFAPEFDGINCFDSIVSL